MFLSPQGTREFFDLAVVVDVLRATTTLLFAVCSGAREIIPAVSVAHARRLKSALENKSPLLCGERNGRRIPGFDLGNSPLEYSPEMVRGRVLIYASTNGSVAMNFAQTIAKVVVLASLRNLSAVVRYIRKTKPESLVVVCSGRDGLPSLEDTYCAGLLLSRLGKTEFLNDECYFAVGLPRFFGENTLSVMENSYHGRYLSETLGFVEDIKLASQLDVDDIVPFIEDGRVVV